MPSKNCVSWKAFPSRVCGKEPICGSFASGKRNPASKIACIAVPRCRVLCDRPQDPRMGRRARIPGLALVALVSLICTASAAASCGNGVREEREQCEDGVLIIQLIVIANASINLVRYATLRPSCRYSNLCAIRQHLRRRWLLPDVRMRG